MSSTSLLIVDRDQSDRTRYLIDLAADAHVGVGSFPFSSRERPLVLEASGWGGMPRGHRRLDARIFTPNEVLGAEAVDSEVLERVFTTSRWLIRPGADGGEPLFPEHRGVRMGLLNLLRIQYYLQGFYAMQAAAERLVQAESIERCHVLTMDPSIARALSRNLGMRGVEVTASTPDAAKRAWGRARWAGIRLKAAAPALPTADREIDELAGLEPAALFVSESKPMDQMFRRVESVLCSRGTTPLVRIGLADAQPDPERSRGVRHKFLEPVSDRAYAAEDRHRSWRRALEVLEDAETVVDPARNQHVPVRTLVSFLHRELMGPQLAHIDRAERILEEVRPELVVVGNDHFWVGQTFVQLARARNIPTVALQDGAAYDAPPWWWTTANRTAASGQALADYLARHGVTEDECVVTGQPRYDRLAELTGQEERAACRERLGLPQDELVILFATQYGQAAGYVRSVVEALASVPDARLLVRPHPSQDPAFHRRLVREQDSELITLCERQDILDLVCACDILVAHNSTVILEAAYLGRQIIVANFGDLPERLPYEDFASADVVRRPEELVATARDLASALRSGDSRVAHDCRRSVDPILGPVDGEAGVRVADLLESMIDDRRKVDRTVSRGRDDGRRAHRGVAAEGGRTG